MSLLRTHNINDGAFFGNCNVSTIESLPNALYKKSVCRLLPRNPIPTTVFQSGSFDMQWDITSGCGIDYLSNMYLCFTLSNSNGLTGAAFVDLPNWFDYFTIETNGVMTQTLYPQAIRNNIIASNYSEGLASVLPGMGISTTDYSANLTIAPSSTFNAILPLQSFLNTSEVPFFRRDVSYRIIGRCKGGPQLLTSTTSALITDVSVVSGTCELRLSGIVLAPEVRYAHDLQLMSGGVKQYRYLDQSRDVISCASVTAATPFTVNYSTSGSLCFMYPQLQVTSATGAQLVDSAAITSIDFLKSNETVFHNLGDNNYTTVFMKVRMAEMWDNSSLFTNRTIYQVGASDDPQTDLQYGSCHGVFRVSGSDETIRITPTNNVTNAVLTVTAMWYSHLEIDYSAGGIARAHRREI
jgi:hypothetical protein